MDAMSIDELMNFHKLARERRGTDEKKYGFKYQVENA